MDKAMLSMQQDHEVLDLWEHIRLASTDSSQQTGMSKAADHLKLEEKVVFIGACLSEDLNDAIFCLKHLFLLPATQPAAPMEWVQDALYSYPALLPAAQPCHKEVGPHCIVSRCHFVYQALWAAFCK